MNPILLDFPDSFETERLTIRCPMPGDGATVNAAVIESLDDLRPWMPWAQKAPALEETELVARQGRISWLDRSDLRLLLFLKGTNTYVGGSGLHRIDWNVPKFEIGYWCRSSMQGKGYITEATEGVAKFAFEILKARRVELLIDERNVRSRKIPERLGYNQEAVIINHSLGAQGQLRNMVIYAKTV